jgi:DNA-directed RNA polymerase subunit RPC12/RpoP
MIRFACPRCKAVLEREPEAAGKEMNCVTCGQRLVIPAALVPQPSPVPPSVPPADRSPVKIEAILGRDFVFWDCPHCHNPVDVPVASGAAVRCPDCGQRIAVPVVASRSTPAAPTPAVRPAAAKATRMSQAPVREAPTRAGPRDRTEDERDVRFPRRRYNDVESRMAARGAIAGLSSSLASLGLLLLSFVLWILTIQAPRSRVRSVLFIVFMIVSVSFILSFLGIIFGSRGTSPANETNRGMGVAALVCGIIALVLSSLVGMLVTCAGWVFISELP